MPPEHPPYPIAPSSPQDNKSNFHTDSWLHQDWLYSLQVVQHFAPSTQVRIGQTYCCLPSATQNEVCASDESKPEATIQLLLLK